MQESKAVAQGMQDFYDHFSSNDPVEFAKSISSWGGSFVIGTDPGEMTTDREGWLAGYQEQITAIPGVRMEAGNLRAYADGPMGFAVDNPSFVVPGGPRLPTRLSAVLRLEGGSWKLLNAHFSIGVPNAEVFELLEKWTTAQPHGI